MEGLLTALLSIHNAIDVPENPATPFMIEPIAKIYTLVFFFLTEFMDWYVRRSTCQLLKSHSQDVHSEFYHLVNCIQRQAKALSDHTDDMDVDEDCEASYSPRALWEDSQLSQVGRQGTERRIAAQNTITRRLIWEIQQDAEERARIKEQRGQLLAQMLRNVSQQLRTVSEQSSGIVCLTTAAPDLGRCTPDCMTQSESHTNKNIFYSHIWFRMVPRFQATSCPARIAKCFEGPSSLLR